MWSTLLQTIKDTRYCSPRSSTASFSILMGRSRKEGRPEEKAMQKRAWPITSGIGDPVSSQLQIVRCCRPNAVHSRPCQHSYGHAGRLRSQLPTVGAAPQPSLFERAKQSIANSEIGRAFWQEGTARPKPSSREPATRNPCLAYRDGQQTLPEPEVTSISFPASEADRQERQAAEFTRKNIRSSAASPLVSMTLERVFARLPIWPYCSLLLNSNH